MAHHQPPQTRDDFEIAIICALTIEAEPVQALFDEVYHENQHAFRKAPGDTNHYLLGRIGHHYVVLVQLSGMGSVAAATSSAHLSSSFRRIRVAFLVGICGGVPQTSDGRDVFLGDVIISNSVIHGDFGRQYPNRFERKRGLDDILGRANQELRGFLARLSGQMTQATVRQEIVNYMSQICQKNGYMEPTYPGLSADVLYLSEHRHKHWSQDSSPCSVCSDETDDVCEASEKAVCGDIGCYQASSTRRVRTQKSTNPEAAGPQSINPSDIDAVHPEPAVFFGRIVSTNHVMKSGQHRDRVVQQEKVIGFEMEGAGVWDNVPTIVIKSVCDYADSHKDKRWQRYAAIVAAACTRAVLGEWRSTDRLPSDSAIVKRLHSSDNRSQPNTVAARPDNTSMSDTDYPVHWNISRSRNSLFTGRGDLLVSLETTVQQAVAKREQCQIVIIGVGGQGKSEICLQLAHNLKDMFWGIFWIDVSTTSQAEVGFVAIGARLRTASQEWEEARQYLANLKQPWLLVLDNADDPNVDYQPYFPAGGSGVTILTSRNKECARLATSPAIMLDGLTTMEAETLLFRTLGISAGQDQNLKDDASEIVRLLQAHPLAMLQAGSYIARGHCKLKEYPAIFQSQRQRLLSYGLTQAQSRYKDVYATFEASADAMLLMGTDCANDALQLLGILSFYAPSRLPLSLFELAWKGAQSITPGEVVDDNDLRVMTIDHKDRLPSFMTIDTASWDSFRLIEAVHLLKSFSLLSVDSTDGITSVSMHHLVHAWARDRLLLKQQEEQQHEFWVQASCVVMMSSINGEWWRRNWVQLQPHMHTLLSWDMDKMFMSESQTMVCRILTHCGWQLAAVSDDVKLLDLVVNLLAFLRLESLQVTSQWIDIFLLAQMAWYYDDRPKDSIIVLNQIIAIQSVELVEDDPALLTSQQYLAQAYILDAQVKVGISLLEHVVAAQEELPKDHPDRLASQHELAGAYLDDGRITEAISLFEHIVTAEEVLPKDHSQRLTSQHELARAYLADGRITEAISLLEYVVTAREVFPKDHPHLLVSQHELARAYLDDGRITEAISLLEHVVTVEEVLPKDHPQRLVSQHELARAYLDDGRITEAISLFEHVVTVREVLPKDHPQRLLSQCELARAYLDDGRITEAISLLEQVVEAKEHNMDENDRSRLGSTFLLSQGYYLSGNHGSALELVEEVVGVMQRSPEKYYDFREKAEELLRRWQAVDHGNRISESDVESVASSSELEMLDGMVLDANESVE